MSERQSFNPEVQRYIERMNEHFPSPNDWLVLGGKPRVFMPENPRHAWKVVHVDDSRETSEQRFANGSIIPTMPRGTLREDHVELPGNEFQKLSIPVIEIDYDENDEEVVLNTGESKDIFVPSFMLMGLHGKPCADRSQSMGGKSDYPRIKSQRHYNNFITKLKEENYEELVYSIKPDYSGYYLKRQEIRDPRPLSE